MRISDWSSEVCSSDLRGWEPAGKTGTSKNNADAWFVGTVPTLSVATWLGHPDAAHPVPGLTGGTAAAPIWHDFVAAAPAGLDPIPFPDPPPLPARQPPAPPHPHVQPPPPRPPAVQGPRPAPRSPPRAPP